jgi:hypothetical protein
MKIREFSSCLVYQDRHGLALGAASARFMVRGCEHGCRFKASKRGLHQTHLRGLPRRPERRLDCGKGWSRWRRDSSSRPRNSAVPRRRPVRLFKITGSSLIADGLPCGSGRGGERRPSDGAARRAGSGRVILRFVVSSQVRATVRGPTKPMGSGTVTHGESQARYSDSWLSRSGPERCRSFKTPCWRSALWCPSSAPSSPDRAWFIASSLKARPS